MISTVAILSTSTMFCNYLFFLVVEIMKFSLLASLVIVISFIYNSLFLNNDLEGLGSHLLLTFS